MHGNARKLVVGRERLYKSRFTSRQAVQQPQGGGPFGTRLQPELSLAFIDESPRMRSPSAACSVISNPISPRPDPNRRGSSTSRLTARRSNGPRSHPPSAQSSCRRRVHPSRWRLRVQGRIRKTHQVTAIRLSERRLKHTTRGAQHLGPATPYVLTPLTRTVAWCLPPESL